MQLNLFATFCFWCSWFNVYSAFFNAFAVDGSGNKEFSTQRVSQLSQLPHWFAFVMYADIYIYTYVYICVYNTI